MPKPAQLRPFDVVVALRLLRPAGTLTVLGEQLAAAPSQVHAALRRLDLAGLLRPELRATNPRALTDFLLSGLRFVFPVTRGPIASGIPTAYSAAPLNSLVDATDVVVWPAPRESDTVRGFSVVPLYPRAVALRRTDPATYQLLTVADALRLGDARLRGHARDVLEAAIA